MNKIKHNMIPIDLRTVYLSYIISEFVGFIVILIFFFQTSKRFPNIKFILYSFALHFTGTSFIFLRGSIPDWLSIPVGNTFSVSSTLILLIGLEQFTKKKSNQIHNYILVFLFLVVHTYFAFIKPHLEYRSFNASVAFFILCSQIAWLMLWRVSGDLKKTTRWVGLTMLAFSAIHLYKIIDFFRVNNAEIDYFKMQSAESVFILVNIAVFLLLIFSLVLMYNKQLLVDIGFQEEKFYKAFHSAPTAFILTRQNDGKIFEVNNGFVKMTGYTAMDVTDRTTIDLRLWENDSDRERLIDILSINGKINSAEYLFRIKNGTIITGLYSSEMIKINDEKCIISIITDISDRKKHEQKLKEQAKQLTALNSAKDKLFSIIAHDLKGPFNNILGLSEVLKNESKNLDHSTVQLFANNLYVSSHQSYRLLENLLDWARMQQGTIHYRPSLLNINHIANETIEMISENAKQKGIKLSNIIPANLMVMADENLTKTVIRNLVNNAVKFTYQGGSVEIGTKIDIEGVAIYIKDSGIGISPEKLNTLFSENEILSTEGTQNEKGTGLGLMICKEFVEINGGKIWVESYEGKGSTFYFSIRQAQKDGEE